MANAFGRGLLGLGMMLLLSAAPALADDSAGGGQQARALIERQLDAFAHDDAAAAYALAYVVLRFAMAWTVGVWGLGDPVTRRSIWLLPLRDLANFGVWVAGFFSNTVHWRGLAFRVKQGLLIPLQHVKGARAEN